MILAIMLNNIQIIKGIYDIIVISTHTSSAEVVTAANHPWGSQGRFTSKGDPCYGGRDVAHFTVNLRIER